MHKTLAQDHVVPRSRAWSHSRAWEWIAVSMITLGAFGLRLWALRWGLPYVDHPDEPALMNVVLRMLRDGDLNPHFFLYPSLYFYLLCAVLALHHRWGLASGQYQPLDQMLITTDLYTTIPAFFVWGRLLAVVLGSLTVLLMYGLGKRSWSGTAGLCAALVVATAPFHLRHSQYVTTDVASAALVVCAYLGATAIALHGGWRWYLLAGLCAGLAASVKYNAALIVLPIAVAHLIQWRGRSLREAGRVIAAAALAVAGFLLGTPYALLAWPEFSHDLIYQLRHYSAGAHGDLVGAWPLAGYLEFVWRDGVRPMPALALVGGVLVLAWRARWVLALWLSFVGPYLLLHLAQESHFMRNLLPLLVLCALPIGVAGAAMIEGLQQFRSLPRVLAPAIVLLVFFAQPLNAALGLTMFYARPNSKVLASEFVRSLPRGQRIAVELNPVGWSGDPVIEPVTYLTEHSADWYRANNYRYLVASSAHRDLQDQAAFDQIKRSATTIRSFAGDDAGQPGPQIDVLDLDPSPDQIALVPRRVRFGDELGLLGYELQPGDLRAAITPLNGADQRTLVSGQSVQINLTWQALRMPTQDWMLFVHVLDAQGNKVAQRDAVLRQDEYPSSRWAADEIVVDRADLPLPALPAGTYTIALGLYELETGARLPLAPEDDRSDLLIDATTLRLTTIEVR